MQVGDDACHRFVAGSRSETIMARPKGFKLSDEQKARMQAGRKAAKAKASKNLIDTEVKTKKVKNEVMVIGYGMDKGENERPYPIFASEEKEYRGRIFASAKEARESRK
jgi:hypothetical protein